MRYKGLLLSISLIGLLVGCKGDDVSVSFQMAEDLWEKGFYNEAIMRYEEIVRVYPQSEFPPKALYKIGIIQNLYLQEFKTALKTFKKLFFLFPESKEASLARRHMADIYMYKLGDYKRALFEYQQLIEDRVIDDPDNVQFNVAMAYIKLGDFEQARIEFNNLMDRFSSSILIPRAYFEIANSYLLEGKEDMAIDSYRKIVKFYPASPFYIDSKFGTAVALEEMGELHEALTLYKELEREHPNPPAIQVRVERLKKRLKR